MFDLFREVKLLPVVILWTSVYNLSGQSEITSDSVRINCFCRDYTNYYFNKRSNDTTFGLANYDILPLITTYKKWSFINNESLIFESACLGYLHGYKSRPADAIENAVNILAFLNDINFFGLKDANPWKTVNFLSLDHGSFNNISKEIKENGSTAEVKKYWSYALKMLVTNMKE